MFFEHQSFHCSLPDSLNKNVQVYKEFKIVFGSIQVLKQIARKNLKRAYLPFNSIKTFRAEEDKMSVFIGITQYKDHEDILVRFSLTIRLWQPACDLH